MSGYLQKPGSVGTTTTINGLSGNVTLSAGNNVSLVETGNDIQINANFTQTGKYMISGGATWSGTGLTYDVSTLTYFFNGNKTANQSQVTLDASDPSNNRIDAIVVDEAGVVSVITGDAAASPVEPPIPEDQLQVQFILVEAGSTTPTVLSESIYLDDPTTNWTFSTYTTATPATGTINFAGTNTPKQGINDIEASTDLRLGARFVRSTSFDAFQYSMFSVWVRFTGTAVATNKSLNVRFENSAGTLVGNTVNLFSFGLSRSILNTWQLVVIPITAFGALPATVKGLKVIMAGGTVGQARQWDIDYMILTNGSVPSANVPTIVFAKDGTNIASQSGINLIEGTGVTITGVNNPTLNRVDYTINASGGSSPITIANTTTLYSSGLSNTGTGDIALGNNIFFGDYAGYGAISAYFSNFLGLAAGYSATNASFSNFLGYNAGNGATNASNSNFLGYSAGQYATGANNSNFFGSSAGQNATNAWDSNFFGSSAGYGATGAYGSNFLGNSAGQNATNAYGSNFFGVHAGYSATSASFSNFLGQSAGQNATNAYGSNFLGYSAGSGATNASNSIFIGTSAGNNDLVNNTGSPDDFSILIGPNTSTGGYSNSIALGGSATNTASNQFMIGSTTRPINKMIVKGTGGIQVPVGTTAERSATQGTIRYNTTTSKFEGYDGSTWVDLN